MFSTSLLLGGIMGLLTPSEQEVLLFQRMFEEKVRLIGTEGFYYEVKDHKVDELARHDRMQHFDPIKINFIFEDMPNPKTLRNLNWWDDTDETVSPIAYLPWHVDEARSYELKPTIGSLIEIKDPLSKGSRFFEIQEVNINSLFLVNTIVKLSPARFNKRGDIDFTEDLSVKADGGTGYDLINP